MSEKNHNDKHDENVSNDNDKASRHSNMFMTDAYPSVPAPQLDARSQESVARAMCVAAHAGQFDKLGHPYHEHPFAVASECFGAARVVAYLHDIVEDTDVSLDDLALVGMPQSIVDAVDAITRRADETYFEYIDRLKDNELARTVKMVDLAHNMSPLRSAGLSDSHRKRYVKAMRILSEVDD